MRLSKYCKQQDMNYEEYKKYKKMIEEKSTEIFDRLRKFSHVGSGIYHPTSQIIDDIPEKPFIINRLKDYGVEFIKDSEYYRY